MGSRINENDILDFVLDPQSIVTEMPADKVRILLVELDMIMEDYVRDLAIAYLCSNYSSKKHLCTTVLKGKHDHEIKAAASAVKAFLVTELANRKNKD